MTFTPAVANPSWAFQTNQAAPAVDYAAGFYDFGASDDDFNPAINYGTAASAYAAHVFIVTGAVPGSDVTIRVSGSSITDEGVYTAVDTEDIVVPSATAVDTYFETTKKWLGQVNISKAVGPDTVCNYGLCKYHDVNNSYFCVVGLECLWESDSTDTGNDIKFRHHKATGWTFNSGAEPTPPPPIASRLGDYTAADNDNVSGEEGAWKRTNLNLAIDGTGSEGFLFEVVSQNAAPGNLSFRSMTLQVSLRV